MSQLTNRTLFSANNCLPSEFIDGKPTHLRVALPRHDLSLCQQVPGVHPRPGLVHLVVLDLGAVLAGL